MDLMRRTIAQGWERFRDIVLSPSGDGRGGHNFVLILGVFELLDWKGYGCGMIGLSQGCLTVAHDESVRNSKTLEMNCKLYWIA